MRRLALVSFLLVSAASAGPDLEARIAEIERINVTQPWQQSAALIEKMAPDLTGATIEQRTRVELLRLRNLALAGDNRAGIDKVQSLLEQTLPPAQRIRAYSLGVNMAANIGDHQRAFTWLKEGLAILPERGDGRVRFLGMASYLYALVGEREWSLDFADKEWRAAEQSSDLRSRCLALSDLALAQDLAQQFSASERSRRRQLDACQAASDPVFIANAKAGLGSMLMKQARPADALPWLRVALGEFERAAFENGVLETKSDVAAALLALNRDRAEAEALLAEVAPKFEQQGNWLLLESARRQQCLVAEQRGDWPQALQALKLADQAAKKMQEEAKLRQLAFLQVEFHSRFKDQQIALLEKDQDIAALKTRDAERRQWLLGLGVLLLLLMALTLTHLLNRTRRDRHRYRWLSERDGLTGLYNHQSARELGAAAFRAAASAARPFTVVIADVDHFKEINDGYGHAAGDEVLRQLGIWLRAVCAEHGCLGRSGGEEFTLYLNTDPAGAKALIEQLRQRIQPVVVANHHIRITLSFGLCAAAAGADDFDQLLRTADQAMYQAKRGGRDQVVEAGEPVPPAAASAASAGRAGEAADAQGSASAASAGRAGAAELVVVGTGIELGRHITERALSEIRLADSVFCLADAFALALVMDLRPDTISLSPYYAEGKDRRQTYREMQAAIRAELQQNKRVCAVFYGHPGVFAQVPHAAIREARSAGIPARMEAAVSAEACLYADLGLDPGQSGVQSLEATQFLVGDHCLDSSSLLLLWQVALSGDLSCTRFHAEAEGLAALVQKLLQTYPAEHEVMLYEAAVLPIQKFRADRLRLDELPIARYQEFTTLVIPPLRHWARTPIEQ